MTEKILVASVQLRDSYSIAGKSVTWLTNMEFHIGYEPDTDKLVVQRKGDSDIHIIPWSNVKGFALERKQQAAPPEPVKAPTNGTSGSAPGGGRRRTGTAPQA